MDSLRPVIMDGCGMFRRDGPRKRPCKRPGTIVHIRRVDTACIALNPRHRLLGGLGGRGWTIVYSSGAMSLWDRRKEVWRRAPLLGRVERAGNIFVDRPGKLLPRWPSRALWDPFAVRWHAHRMRAALNAAHDGAIAAILFHPEFWPYVGALAPRHVVYFVYDAHSLAPGWTEELAEFEARLIERADLVVGFSREMLDLLPGEGPRRGRVLPTGVDVAMFAEVEKTDVPADLAPIPRPRIGYVGRINRKLDIALIATLAKAAPHQQWIFVGPVVEADPSGDFAKTWRDCVCLPNVHHLGPKSHAEVPRYMRHMDVNIMCSRTEGGWWIASYPLKMHEYLAVGGPIISSDLSTVRPFSQIIDIAHTPDEWMAAIERALTSGGVGTPEQRRAVALENTWDKRVDQLEEWLFEMIASS